MTSHIDVVRLSEYCDVDSGFAFKSERFSQNPEDINLVKGSNLGHRTIDWDEGPRWSKDEYEKLKFYGLKTDDLVLAMDRPIVGGNLKFAWIAKSDPKALLVQRVARLRAKEGLDQTYLRYVIADSAFKLYIDTITTGANIPHISGPDIRDYKFPLPSLPTQKKIAAILSAYDDLIENNLKRIKLLEEMAQITYDEWFVRLKFPGHETTPMDSETGLPFGWQRIFLDQACDVSGGGTPSTEVDEYWIGGDITWFSPTDLSKNNSLVLLDSSQKITEKGLQKSSAKLMQPNSFMMTSRATIGLFGLFDQPFCTNQGFINVTPRKASHKYFLLFNLKLRVPEFLNYASGATFLELSKSKFKRLKIDWPSETLIEKWHEFSNPIVQEITNLSKQNQLLKEARDILLPRLMTGMIDVEQLVLPEPFSNTASSPYQEPQAA